MMALIMSYLHVVASRNISVLMKQFPPTHQDPNISPPLPIIDLSEGFIDAVKKEIHGNSSALQRREGPLTCSPSQPCADKR